MNGLAAAARTVVMPSKKAGLVPDGPAQVVAGGGDLMSPPTDTTSQGLGDSQRRVSLGPRIRPRLAL